MTTTIGPPRPLRADAARNHRRIVEAAVSAFSAEGPDVVLEEIARRAGVGVATLYRRFRTREALVRAVLDELIITEVQPGAAAGAGDPWDDLSGSLSRAVETIAGHRTILRLARECGAFDVESVQRYGRAMSGLLDRARTCGAVRPELTPRDLSAVLVMAAAVVDLSGSPAAGPLDAAARRYVALLLDGLRAGNPPLPPG